MIKEILINLLSFIYSQVNNLGLSIVLLTLLIKSLLLPLSIPSQKAQKKMTTVTPEIEKLKKKYKNDPKSLQQAQLELYKKYNMNPLAGCLPQIVMLVVLIGLYQSLNHFLDQGRVAEAAINTRFLWLDLIQPDKTYILPILAGVSQLALSLMISPGAEIRDIVPNQSKNKKIQQKNKNEEDMASMAKSMQQQMLFMMPVLTTIVATRFPSGLAVYWVVANIFTLVQQYLVSGPGGLVSYYNRAKQYLVNYGANQINQK